MILQVNEQKKEYKTKIELTDKQKFVYLNYFKKIKLNQLCLYGSSRSGKSFLIAYFFLQRSLEYPKSYQIFIRKHFSAIRSGLVLQTFPEIFDIISKQNNNKHPFNFNVNGQPFVKYNGSDNLFRFYNGSEIRFAGLDTQSTNKNATDKILSTEYITADIEEGTEIDFEVVEKIQTRLSQKIKSVNGKSAIPKLITSLNPTTFDAWDYLYFQKGENPKSHEQYSELQMSQRAAVHFHVLDNIQNLSSDYLQKLEMLSPNEKRRFLEGLHGDNYEGEIFKQLTWESLPNIKEFSKILIYTDPSYKSGVRNDYKASVVLGLRNGAFWIIDAEAMQCTTSQMILNVHNLFHSLRENGYTGIIDCFFENAGMPDDFAEAVQKHAETSGWVCPYRYDNRQKGDKYARIESALVPLNEQGKLLFNVELKQKRVGNLINVQMLSFKKNLASNEHDDIPDAIHGGITLLNIPIVSSIGVGFVRRGAQITC